MSTRQLSRNGSVRRPMLVAAALLLFAGCSPAGAQLRPSEAQILNALKPPVARSLTGAPSPEDARRQTVIENLRVKSRTRSLTGDEREQLATVAAGRPSIDLEIYFDYNSAKISPKAVPDLMTLGRALSDQELKGGVFLVAGHTDAKGSSGYNQGLSERRAQAVKEFLVSKFRLTSDTLVSAGYGKDQLKNKDNPLAGENRRVQILNLESKQEAAK